MQEKLNFHYLGAELVSCVHEYRAISGNNNFNSRVRKKLLKLRHFILSVLTGSEIDILSKIGADLKLPHPHGVIIHRNAVIGEGCLIMQQVTIGQLSDVEAPVLGRGVYVGAGAKVLGCVHVGDGSRIGANAVVLDDVPMGWTAVGVPARLIPPRVDGGY